MADSQIFAGFPRNVSQFEQILMQGGPCSKAINTVGVISGMALFVVATLGLAGVVNGVVMGGCAVGLSVPVLITNINLARKVRGPFKVMPISQAALHAAIAILGALGIAGVVSASSIGWVVLMPYFIALGTILLVACCCCPCITYGVAQHVRSIREDERLSNT